MHYDRMVEDALRTVARRALEHAARDGLPGEHHFYLTFRTDDPEVAISEALAGRYPDEMTIVLQHQYWALEVDDAGFGVTLTFASVPERLEVPWRALTAFHDPSVQFGLQFQYRAGEAQGGGPVVALGPAAEAPQTSEPPASVEPAETAPEAEAEKIVTLDRFRKK